MFLSPKEGSSGLLSPDLPDKTFTQKELEGITSLEKKWKDI